MKYDVLVIGNGIAGGIAALLLAKSGKRVLVTTKGESFEESNTAQAQGGIVFRGENDHWTLLFKDIMEASNYSSWEKSARWVCKLGPYLVEKILIKELGIPFDRSCDGKWELFQEGAHSRRRILHVKDYTGKVIQEAINQCLKKEPKIEVKNNFFALELITSNQLPEVSWRYRRNSCLGSYFLDKKSNVITPVFADYTILATGGLNQIYKHASGGKWCTGDGFAMAKRAGCSLINMEFIQFHPTILYKPGSASTLLISEAVRGEGAELVDADGKPFMKKYHPLGSLAPRDIVARAIFQEMEKKGLPCVYLDLYRKMQPQKIRETFPYIYQEALKQGIDITREPIPVVPGAHFACGGVRIDTRSRTDIERLYAIGEVACSGVHGANRLASVSLLDGLTFAYLATKDILAQKTASPRLPTRLPCVPPAGEAPPESLLSDLTHEIQEIMWKKVGLLRNGKELRKATQELLKLRCRISQLFETFGVSQPLKELENLVEVSLMVAKAAFDNPFSLGTHYRSDQPV